MATQPTSPFKSTIAKGVLAMAVIGSYIVYSFHQRHEVSGAVGTPTSSSSSTTQSTPTSAPAVAYKDGSYTGSPTDAFYGTIQVEAIVTGGKISDVKFLQYPNDQPNSVRVNTIAMPLLKQEAISAQSAKVDTVTGATASSDAFVQSLGDALAQAK